jgi:glycosyltransferase involved in cell wall biosynthesis
VSDGQARELVEKYRICGWDRMRVVPLGFDLDLFDPAATGEARAELRREIGVNTEPLVTMVGRLVPIKNHDLFLRLAARLVEQGSKARFLVVGGGSEESRLRGLAVELGLADRVHFLGWRSDLERIYAGSDLVVLTSINEGTPVCLIEALAAGRAVVATDVGGVSDVLEQGRLGRLVPAGDLDGLVTAVAELLENSERRAELGATGPEVARRRFGVERLLYDVETLYDEISSVRARPNHESHELIAS